MKKIICAFLCVAVLSMISLPMIAAECVHNYIAVHFDADCQHTARTVYTCELCGDCYTVYDSEFTEPEGLYLLATSEKIGNSVVLKVYLYNNPGIDTAVLRIYYNNEAVVPVDYENGEVWDEENYWESWLVTLDPSSDHVSICTDSSSSNANTNNGLYFTLTFDIVGDYADCNISPVYPNKGFVALDYNTNKVVERKPEVIDLITKSDLGEHRWELEEVVCKADFENNGEELYVCGVCGERKTVTTDKLVHWLKADLDNNGMINSKDSFEMKKYMLGYEPDCLLQFEDAADINSDGYVNPKDSFFMKLIILGRNPFE